MPNNVVGEEVMFEDQYHPRAIDIFGTGGEVIHKVNNADNVVEEEDNEDGSSLADAANGPTRNTILYTNTKDMPDDIPLSGMKDGQAKALSKRSVDLESQKHSAAAPASFRR